VTYAGFAAAWPSREGSFADKVNGMPKSLFADGTQARLGLAETTPVGGDGVVVLTYVPAG